MSKKHQKRKASPFPFGPYPASLDGLVSTVFGVPVPERGAMPPRTLAPDPQVIRVDMDGLLDADLKLPAEAALTPDNLNTVLLIQALRDLERVGRYIGGEGLATTP